MTLRYEWGIGVGHTYAYKDATAANNRVLLTHSPPHNAPELTEGGDGDVGQGNTREGEGEGVAEDDEDEDEDEESDAGDSEDDDPYNDFRDPDYDSEVERELALFGDEY